MGRRLICDKTRGWYGWESREHAVLRMTIGSITQANAKNQQERFKHRRKLSKISDEEREFRYRSRKSIDAMRNELKEMEAYKKVYQQYSLRRVEADKEEETKEVENNEKTAQEEEKVSTESVLPISPFWTIYSKNKNLQTNKTDTEEEPNKRKKTFGYLKPLRNKDQMPSISRRNSKFKREDQSSVATHGDEADPIRKTSRTGSNWAPPARNIQEYGMCPIRKVSTLSVYDKLDPINSTENVNAEGSSQDIESDTNNNTNGKALTEDDLLQMATMSSNSIKKFLGEEAERYLAANAPEIRRQRKIKHLLEKDTFPELVVRSKTTSAIFKDYRVFKGKTLLTRPRNSTGVSTGDLEDNDKRVEDIQSQPLGLQRNKTTLPSIKLQNTTLTETMHH